MRIARVTIEGLTPYSQSKVMESPRNDKELAKDHEERCWRERCHVDKDGRLFVPPTAFKNGLASTAKAYSQTIPGKGKQTWTKHFEMGIQVVEPLPLAVKLADVRGEWVFVPSDGKRGGTKRVWKCFPVIETWGGVVEFLVLDDTITKGIFEEYVADFGRFIGIGRFRPQNNGFYGRFKVLSVEWDGK